MEFVEWLKEQGCAVEVTQEDDGGGYFVIEVSYPIWKADIGSSVMSEPLDVTVTV